MAFGSRADLTEIKSKIASASPAGRLYLAALVQKLDKMEGDRLLNSMLSDADPVIEKSGCTIGTLPASYFAKELLQHGSVAIGLP